MNRILVMMGGLLVAMAPLTAQTLPSGVAFDVHLTQHASSTVRGYKVYVVIGTNTVRITDIGKPMPSGRTITHINPGLFTGLAAGTYSVHTTAYGPGGESGPSNKAPFSIASTGTSAPLPPTNTEPVYNDPAPTPTPTPTPTPDPDPDPDPDPAPVPGIVMVEAEHFDNGGQGVAYYDLTPGNAGGTFRNTDVDIAASADSGGGHIVGWTGAGEWLNYTVEVAAAGSYNLEVRVASARQGGTFHIEVNGVDKTGPLTVPATGGWQVWTTIRRRAVTLEAGRQLWTLVMDSNGSSSAVGNINWIRAVPR